MSVLKLKEGGLRRTLLDAADRVTTTNGGTNGMTTTTAPDGTVVVVRESPDPRYGMRAPVIAEQVITTPSGLTWTQTAARTAALADPRNIFSLQSESDTWSINSRPYTSDASTRRSTFRTPTGRTSVATFDGVGRLVRAEIAGLPAIEYSFDGGRLSTVSSGGRATSLTYNARQELTAVRDALGREVTFGYDAAGRVTRQTRADGRSLAFGYDEAGNLTSVIPAGRPQHLLTYSSVGAISGYIPPVVPGGGATTYAYNRDRQLTSATRPDGQTLSIGYDAAGRLSSISGSQAAYGFGYLPGGQLGTLTHGGESSTYSYDGPLVTSVTASGTIAGTVAWTWDNDFWLTSESVNDVNVAFGYDADGLLVTAGGLTLSRDAQNGLLMGSTLGSVSDTWSYDARGEVSTYAAAFNGSPLLSFTYGRDNGGRITSIGSQGFEYNKDGRLARVTRSGTAVAEYDYDDNGNRIAHRYQGGSDAATYDDQDRLLTYGDTSYQYTANGELKAKTVAGATTTFDYDALGNLRKVVMPGGRTIEYVIDGQNRRIGKKVDGALVQGWLYADQLRIVAEVDGANRVVSRFVYGTRTNVPDYMIKAGVVYRLVSDHLGSPRLVVNVSDGTVAQSIDYDEFGRVRTDMNADVQPFGFAGGLYDRDTGLVRLGARDYDAHVGRWLAKDALGFSGGDANLYAYVFSDPVNLLDPAGLDAVTSDATVRQYFYDLWKSAGRGSHRTERAGWVLKDPISGKYGCKRWPWSAKDSQETWKGPVPPNMVALGHTHPDSKSPKPSTGGTKRDPRDDYTARQTNAPIYTIAGKGIWKIDPSGVITQEEGPEWIKSVDEKGCTRCQ